jgi:hypothetical protein
MTDDEWKRFLEYKRGELADPEAGPVLRRL